MTSSVRMVAVLGSAALVLGTGMAMPYSGPVSSYGIVGNVNEAYFRMVNDNGGINGRKVTLISYDDQYTPPRTTEVVRKRVEQDEVLAVYGNLGSASNATIMRYMNAKKVPHLFLGVGADRFNDPKNNPWTMPYMPSYEGEGSLYARNILKAMPDAKIAVLYQNDDFGKDLLNGLKKGLGDKASMVVAEASFEIADPTVDSQIIKLQASGADVFVNFATARFAAQAIRKVHDIGWRPKQQYLTYVSAYVKMTMDAVLRASGDNLTRENLLRNATSLKAMHTGMLLPGIALNNSSTDYFPFSTLQLVEFNGQEFEPLGQSIAVK